MAADGQLRAFVERIERLEGAIADLNADKRDVYAEAKALGFDTKALKAVVSIRRKDQGEIQEHNALVALYLSTLGMADAAEAVEETTPRVQAHTHVHVHVREEDHHPAGNPPEAQDDGRTEHDRKATAARTVAGVGCDMSVQAVEVVEGSDGAGGEDQRDWRPTSVPAPSVLDLAIPEFLRRSA